MQIIKEDEELSKTSDKSKSSKKQSMNGLSVGGTVKVLSRIGAQRSLRAKLYKSDTKRDKLLSCIKISDRTQRFNDGVKYANKLVEHVYSNLDTKLDALEAKLDLQDGEDSNNGDSKTSKTSKNSKKRLSNRRGSNNSRNSRNSKNSKNSRNKSEKQSKKSNNKRMSKKYRNKSKYSTLNDSSLDADTEDEYFTVSLTLEEVELLYVSYKHVIDEKRKVLSTIKSTCDELKIDTNLKASILKLRLKRLDYYRSVVVKETEGICEKAIEICDKFLIPNSNHHNRLYVFALKIMGDFYRYLAKLDGLHHYKYKNFVDETYRRGMSAAKECLEPTDMIRLGLGLNYSWAQYDLFQQPREAIYLAREVVNNAVGGLDAVDSDYRDISLILNVIRSNLQDWEKIHKVDLD